MKDNFDEKLGGWLRAKRESRHYTLQYVADQLGVTKTAVHCWETGKRSLYAKTFMDLCAVLGADPEEFVSEAK